MTGRKITDKEHEHVLNVWNKFEMKTMKDYHDFYLKCGVLLLVNMFKKIRKNSLKNHGLCPSHYLSATGLSWDAMLKITNSELELEQILTCRYSLKMVQETEFSIFLIDTAKSIINI